MLCRQPLEPPPRLIRAESAPAVASDQAVPPTRSRRPPPAPQVCLVSGRMGDRTRVHSPTLVDAGPGKQVGGVVVAQPQLTDGGAGGASSLRPLVAAKGRPYRPGARGAPSARRSGWSAAGRPGRLVPVGRGVGVTVRGRQPQRVPLTFRLRGHAASCQWIAQRRVSDRAARMSVDPCRIMRSSTPVASRKGSRRGPSPSSSGRSMRR